MRYFNWINYVNLNQTLSDYSEFVFNVGFYV